MKIPVEFSANAAGPLTEDRLARVTASWQERLRLQDWDIQPVIARACDLGDGHVGDCRPLPHKGYAKIRVLHPSDHEGQSFTLADQAGDWELTVVHELVHIALVGAVPEKQKRHRRDAEERAINNIARALLAAHRVSRELIASRET